MKQNIVQYLMVIMLVAGSYLLGVYKTKSDYLEKGAAQPSAQVAGQQDQAQKEQTTIDLAKIQAKFDGKHITFGDKNAKLVITEISDPSCPYCHVAAGLDPEINNSSAQFKMVKDGGTYNPPVPEIRKLVDEGKASLLFVYSPGHGNGEVGTQALYCAYDQGKFWEAHDALMTQAGYDLLNKVVQNDLTKSKQVVDLFRGKLDTAKLTGCLNSKKYANQPADDAAFVQSLVDPGFNGFGTPTFFINEKVISGAADWNADFKSTVDPLL